MLVEGTDYLYYRSAYHSGGPVPGMTNAEVAVIATRRYLFLIPVHEPAMRRAWFVEGLSISESLARYLAYPPLTIDALEAELLALLPYGEYALPLDELTRLSVWSKFLRQVRFKHRTRPTTQVLALRGKANHERFKDFYADELR